MTSSLLRSGLVGAAATPAALLAARELTVPARQVLRSGSLEEVMTALLATGFLTVSVLFGLCALLALALRVRHPFSTSFLAAPLVLGGTFLLAGVVSSLVPALPLDLRLGAAALVAGASLLAATSWVLSDPPEPSER